MRKPGCPTPNSHQSGSEWASAQLTMYMHRGMSVAEKPNVQKGWYDKGLCDVPNGRFYGNNEFSVGSGARGTLEGQVGVGGE